MSTLCRVAFCPKCFKASRPKGGEPFVVFGSTSQQFFILRTRTRNSQRGFTPHLFQAEDTPPEIENTKVYYIKLCCVCGFDFEFDEETENYKDTKIISGKWSNLLTMPVKRWKALEQFTDTGLKI